MPGHECQMEKQAVLSGTLPSMHQYPAGIRPSWHELARVAEVRQWAYADCLCQKPLGNLSLGSKRFPSQTHHCNPAVFRSVRILQPHVHTFFATKVLDLRRFKRSGRSNVVRLFISFFFFWWSEMVFPAQQQGLIGRCDLYPLFTFYRDEIPPYSRQNVIRQWFLKG